MDYSAVTLLNKKRLEIDDIKNLYLTDIKEEKLKDKILLELEILAKESIELKINMENELGENSRKMIQDLEKLQEEYKYIEYFKHSVKLQNEYMRRTEQLFDKRRKDDESIYQKFNNKFDESINVCLNKIKNTISHAKKQEKRMTLSNQKSAIKAKTKQKSNNFELGM